MIILSPMTIPTFAEAREPDEVLIDDLPDLPLKLQKPHFNYFRVPKEYQELEEGFNLSYARCKACPRFPVCPAVKDEREWFIKNKSEVFAPLIEELSEDAWRQGLPRIPPRRYSAILRQAILNQFDRECVLEKEGVTNLLRQLKKSYNMDDGKIHLVIRELLTNFIHNYRLDNEFSDRGFIISIPHMDGGEVRVPHAGAQIKKEFSRLLLEYIRQLDDLTKEGVSFKIEGEITMREMLDKIVDLDRSPKKLPDKTIREDEQQ